MTKYNKVILIQALKDYYNENGMAPNSKTFHIHQNIYRHHFGNWNKALNAANIPRNSYIIKTACPECGNSFEYIRHLKKTFCSQSCSTTYHNKRRPKKPKNKPKKVLSKYQQWKLTIVGPFCRIHNRTCKHCNGELLPNL